MKRRFALELMVLLFLTGALLGSRIPGDGPEFFDPLVDIRSEITRYYFDEPDQEAMQEGAIEGMIARLNDPFTAYLSPKIVNEFDKQTRGSFSGVGAEITQDDKKQIVIVTPLEDSPALEAGVQPGDVILQINGESTEKMSTDEAVEKIVGPEGTDVRLKLRHPDGEEAELTITRKTIRIQTVKGFRRDGQQHWDYMLDPANGVAYVRLSQFSEPTTRDLCKAIETAKGNGMKGLILDMRFNPGGLLDKAIEVSDLFLSQGTIVSSKGRKRAEQVWSAKSDDDLGDFPVAVLINEHSASAAEIVAGALKDNGRAVVVGTRSFGKGSVQEVHTLGDKGALKITTALYYLPSKRNLHKHEGADVWGVDPDDGFYVPMSGEQIEKMVETRLNSDVLRNSQGGEAKPVTAEYIENDLSDPQLAAAYKAMVGKVQTGEFPRVGAGNATLLAHTSEKTRLEKAREGLQEQLNLVNKRLQELETKLTVEGEAPATERPAPTPAPTERQEKQLPPEIPAKP